MMTTASEIQVKSDIIKFILPRSWTFHKAQIVILQLYKWYIAIAWQKPKTSMFKSNLDAAK